MPATQQRNQLRKTKRRGKLDDLDLLASALRFGGEFNGLVDDDLATKIWGMVDAPEFDAKTHAAEREWYWIASSTLAARSLMAAELRAAIKGALN